MNNISEILRWVILAAMLVLIYGCTIEPVKSDKSEPVVVIPGAPDWVNKGSMLVSVKEGRFFHGVSSTTPQGDLALQKSISDDKSVMEVNRILKNYLDVVGNDYIASTRYGDDGENEDAILRRIDEDASKTVKDSVSRQIDGAISRQFKENVSKQFKEDISRQIKAEANRQIRIATSAQIEFARELEETIAAQIKYSVSYQMKNTARANLASTKIIGSWRDPRTNVIWSMSELDLMQVKSSVADSGDMNIELKNFFEVSADSIFDRIIKERDNPSPFSFK